MGKKTSATELKIHVGVSVMQDQEEGREKLGLQVSLVRVFQTVFGDLSETNSRS
mgnify:CR=1 FL=1